MTREDRIRVVSYRDESAPCVFAKVVDTTTKVEERYSGGAVRLRRVGGRLPLDFVPESDPGKVFGACARYAR